MITVTCRVASEVPSNASTAIGRAHPVPGDPRRSAGARAAEVRRPPLFPLLDRTAPGFRTSRGTVTPAAVGSPIAMPRPEGVAGPAAGQSATGPAGDRNQTPATGDAAPAPVRHSAEPGQRAIRWRHPLAGRGPPRHSAEEPVQPGFAARCRRAAATAKPPSATPAPHHRRPHHRGPHHCAPHHRPARLRSRRLRSASPESAWSPVAWSPASRQSASPRSASPPRSASLYIASPQVHVISGTRHPRIAAPSRMVPSSPGPSTSPSVYRCHQRLRRRPSASAFSPAAT